MIRKYIAATSYRAGRQAGARVCAASQPDNNFPGYIYIHISVLEGRRGTSIRRAITLELAVPCRTIYYTALSVLRKGIGPMELERERERGKDLLLRGRLSRRARVEMRSTRRQTERGVEKVSSDGWAFRENGRVCLFWSLDCNFLFFLFISQELLAILFIRKLRRSQVKLERIKGSI